MICLITTRPIGGTGSCYETRTKSSDFNNLVGDGGSNAIGGVQEYEVLTRSEGRPNNIDFNVCFDHQNERSSGYATGTLQFQENPNAELGAILRKSHEIQVRLNRSGKRMGVYYGVQHEKGRNPKLNPDPANETRWHGK